MSDKKDKQEKGENGMVKVARFVVNKRNMFFLVFGILMIFSAFSRNWVKVENSLAEYLPEATETKRGLNLMEEQFVTYGTAKIMVANISYEEADKEKERLEKIKGVSMVQFDNTEDHYNNFSALYDVSFAYSEDNDKCLESLDLVKEELDAYDIYVSTELGDPSSEIVAQEMNVIIIYVAVIVVSVLFLTSQTYAEVAVLLLTFISAALINMGTNFLFGTISFVSDSVTIVLQLALSVDYAVIFCNRYKEEHETLDSKEATVQALSKAIPEISASSLTTIGGLIAMTFMQYGIGPDLGVILIKAIILSLMAVFLLMPGLLVIFAKAMDKTTHKNLVPKIPFVGKFAHKTRFIIPPVFLVVIGICFFISNNCPYVYGYDLLETPVKNDMQIAEEMIEDSFGKTNMVALIVPAGNYEKEGKLLRDLEAQDEVDYTMGLSNTEALDGYMLTDKLTARQFSELVEVDYELCEMLYGAYAVNDENYAKIVNGVSSYKVALIDMLMFVYDEVQDGYVTLDDDIMDTLEEAHNQMSIAKKQLQGKKYSRMLVYLNLPEEGDETFAFIDKMHDMAGKYYSGKVLVAGEATSQYDLKKTFARDNMVVTVVSILVVLVVLLFTFQSAGMPVLLIFVIEGSIWINFSYPTITNSYLFFLSYLIVSSIQMGANIDYAIVVSSRYMAQKKLMPKKEAIIDTMNFAFPTIVTSGTMLAVAGVLIGQMTSEAAICGIGQCLGRGTILSIFIVMFVLPQILLLCDSIIERTSFEVTIPTQTKKTVGLMQLDGRVNGRINGTIVGEVHVIVRGELDARIDNTGIRQITEAELESILRQEEAVKRLPVKEAPEETRESSAPQPGDMEKTGEKTGGLEETMEAAAGADAVGETAEDTAAQKELKP